LRTQNALDEHPSSPAKSADVVQIESPALKPVLPDSGKVPLLVGDIPKAFLDAGREHKIVAWDIETSGLDWRSERIGLCQVWVREEGLGIVKIKKNKLPRNLAALLEDASIQKIFHHAMFDLRFLCYHWRVNAANIACTKIASKLIEPGRPEGHTLASLLMRYLGISLDKTKRKSDWLSWALSESQLVYAGNDVIHLPELLGVLKRELESRNLDDLAQRCFAHIPTQVQLDIGGYRDVYGY
jgi:ribonuclease D